MPNHVTSIVSVASKYADEDQTDYKMQHEKINKLYKALHTKESEFDFNAIVPQPDGIFRGNLGKKEKNEHPINWYDWNIPNWGTKWNAYSVKYLMDSYDDDMEVFDILVKFETAWSPPMPVLKKLAEDFLVEFTWMNEGNGIWHNWEKLN